MIKLFIIGIFDKINLFPFGRLRLEIEIDPKVKCAPAASFNIDGPGHCLTTRRS